MKLFYSINLCLLIFVNIVQYFTVGLSIVRAIVWYVVVTLLSDNNANCANCKQNLVFVIRLKSAQYTWTVTDNTSRQSKVQIQYFIP